MICDSIEEAVKDSDIISMTTTVKDSEAEFPYIDTKWIKKGALISMPSAARFDEDFLVNGCKKLWTTTNCMRRGRRNIHIRLTTRCRL